MSMSFRDLRTIQAKARVLSPVLTDSTGPWTTSNDIQKQLEDWKAQLDAQDFHPEPDDSPWSPEWHACWEPTWIAYDAIESRRKACGQRRLEWQDYVEEWRCDPAGYRPLILNLLAPSYWELAPLGISVRRFLKLPLRREGSLWNMALEDFELFRDTLGCDMDSSAFAKSLSKSQQTSWKVLIEWWTARYQHPALSEAARLNLRAAASSPMPDSTLKQMSRANDSLYHSWLLELFEYEFRRDHWRPFEKDVNQTNLQMTRRDAVKHALCQRLGHTSLKPRRTPMKSAGLSKSPYVSDVLDPCPWLEVKGEREMPYYLFDTLRKKTVVVESLATTPEYYCISHTWGRWRKGMEESVQLDGVPWLVPANEKFDVRNIAEEVHKLRRLVRYVWLDLVCIPQDGSIKAEEEIARQAAIFRGSRACIAWLHDVSSFSGLEQALSWLGVAYLRSTSHIYATETVFEQVTAAAGSSIEVLRHSPFTLGGGELSGWFTSLWTLQEALLCPDLLLVTNDWQPLADIDGHNISLDTLVYCINHLSHDLKASQPLDHPFQNPSSYRRKLAYQPLEKRETWPHGPQQLLSLHLLTRMGPTLSAREPTSILTMTDLRQCSDTRAPAIMATLGVTDWFLARMHKKGDCNNADDVLILDTYPLDFAQEAARKFGAAFYMSLDSEAHEIPTSQEALAEAVGSMMPFSSQKGMIATHPGFAESISSHPVNDHPSVKSWIVGPKGEVIIKQAGLVASRSSLMCNENEKITVSMNLKSEEPYSAQSKQIVKTSFLSGVNLREWIQGLPAGREVFAVCLLHSCIWYGVILQGNRRSADGASALLLFKTGIFFIEHELAMPESECVDWVVL